MMIYSEEYKEHIEYTFAAFCKVVLRNTAITAYRDFGRKQQREVRWERARPQRGSGSRSSKARTARSAGM